MALSISALLPWLCMHHNQAQCQDAAAACIQVQSKLCLNLRGQYCTLSYAAQVRESTMSHWRWHNGMCYNHAYPQPSNGRLQMFPTPCMAYGNCVWCW